MSDDAQKSVLLLLRADAGECKRDNDHYVGLLENFGLQVIQMSVLDFYFINEDILRHELELPEKFAGIVFTSPRSVEAVATIFHDGGLNSQWTQKTSCYVVGYSTAAKVKDILKWNPSKVCGAQTGNAASLASFIATKHETDAKLLFPCGNLKRTELENGLKENNIILETVVCYETKPRGNISEVLEELVPVVPDFVVFFSPSGVKAAFQFLKDKCNGFANTDVIALGPTTADCLKKHGCEDVLIASNPNAESLVQLLKDQSGTKNQE
jgi:uroporphyrinogen-III synthase